MSHRAKFAALIVLSAVLAFTQTAEAQRGGGGGRGGNLFRGGGNLGLLQDEKVRGELELMDDQVEELGQMRDDFRTEMMESFREFRSMSEEDRQDMMEEMRERATEMEEEANSVLLPHQVDRLKQLAFQRNVGRGGVGGLSNNDALIEALEISEEQIEKMQEIAEEANAKLQEKVASLQQQARDEVLGVLSEEQRTKFDELFGSPFEFDQQGRGGDRGGRGGAGGGDRGGRGGDRGGRGGANPGRDGGRGGANPGRDDF